LCECNQHGLAGERQNTPEERAETRPKSRHTIKITKIVHYTRISLHGMGECIVST
jgi:hypothetical protein